MDRPSEVLNFSGWEVEKLDVSGVLTGCKPAGTLILKPEDLNPKPKTTP